MRALLAQQRQAGAHTIDAGLQASFRRISAPDRLVGGEMSDDQLEAFAMADRVIIMAQGEIAQIGKSKDIYRSPSNKFVAENPWE